MNWPSYLIQVNIYLVLFYVFYVLVLQNETFFKWNRIFLISSAIFSFLIPLIQSDWIRDIFVTDEIQTATQAITLHSGQVLMQIHSAPIKVQNQSLTIIDWVSIIYLTGVLITLSRFIWLLLKASKSFDKGIHAQSFFKKIKVSDNLPLRDSIIKHEEVHASQLHSADVLFFELISILNWFNPLVYGYKKSIKYIHEFIADEVVSSEKGKSEYALLLVSNVFGIHTEQLTNNFFNQSLLKKRIMMLDKTKSRKTALLKYGLSVPLFIAMLVFSSATINTDHVLQNLTTQIKTNQFIKEITPSEKPMLPNEVLEDISDTTKDITNPILANTLDEANLDSGNYKKSVDMPNIQSSEDHSTVLTKFEVTDRNTIVTFEHVGNQGAWIQVNKSMYIQDAHGESIYKLEKVVGIPLRPEKFYFTKDNERLVFQLYFEKIPKEVTKVNIVERARSAQEIAGNISYFNYFGVNLEKTEQNTKIDSIQVAK